MSSLQEDRQRLQASHTVQMEKLLLQLDTQIEKTQLAHTRRVRPERCSCLLVINLFCHDTCLLSQNLRADWSLSVLCPLLGVRTAGSG